MSKIMMHKKTGKLAEMTNSWFGEVIWLVDFDSIPPNHLAIYPFVLYSDDIRFKQYVILGAL